jgi:hypothetical protein
MDHLSSGWLFPAGLIPSASSLAGFLESVIMSEHDGGSLASLSFSRAHE